MNAMMLVLRRCVAGYIGGSSAANPRLAGKRFWAVEDRVEARWNREGRGMVAAIDSGIGRFVDLLPGLAKSALTCSSLVRALVSMEKQCRPPRTS